MEKEKDNSSWKSLMINELTEELKKANDLYLSNYTGLKAEEINQFRRLLEPTDSRYLVVKNSMLKLAFENAGLKGLIKLLDGAVGMLLVGKDPIQSAKILTKFSKAHERLKIKGGYLDGEIVDADRIKYFASLPSRDYLIKKAVFGMKSPILGLVGVLGNTLKGLLCALQAIKEKKKR